MSSRPRGVVRDISDRRNFSFPPRDLSVVLDLHIGLQASPFCPTYRSGTFFQPRVYRLVFASKIYDPETDLHCCLSGAYVPFLAASRVARSKAALPLRLRTVALVAFPEGDTPIKTFAVSPGGMETSGGGPPI